MEESNAKIDVNKNLQDIKISLESILKATSAENLSVVEQNEKVSPESWLQMARLHSQAADAYAQLLDILARRS